MAPILIDKSDLLKLGLLSVLTIVLVFLGGFQFGFHQANMYSDFNVFTERDRQTPLKELITEVKETGQSPSGVSNTAERIDVAQVEAEMQSTEIKVAAVEIEPNQFSVVPTENRLQEKSIVKQKVSNEKEQPILKSSSGIADEEEIIRYSIQVAVYGRLNNAENMMSDLQASKFDAYISESISKKNKVRFNVRFGYFKDKKTALSALKDYIENQKGDGYLVNYSAKDIVDIAQRKSVNEEPVKKSVTLVQVDNRLPVQQVAAPILETTTADITDNVTQVGNMGNSTDLNKKQGNSLIN